MLALCFADDAFVHDEHRDYHGLDGIIAWKRDADAKYRYALEPLDAAVDRNTVRLRVRMTGDFPGSPVEADYTFTLASDKIISLAIE